MPKVNAQRARPVGTSTKAVPIKITIPSIKLHFAIIFKEETALMDKDVPMLMEKQSLDQPMADEL
jgi:hypothetical protein